jgi:hypothetical protein
MFHQIISSFESRQMISLERLQNYLMNPSSCPNPAAENPPLTLESLRENPRKLAITAQEVHTLGYLIEHVISTRSFENLDMVFKCLVCSLGNYNGMQENLIQLVMRLLTPAEDDNHILISALLLKKLVEDNKVLFIFHLHGVVLDLIKYVAFYCEKLGTNTTLGKI